jgi:Tfp pilus assembly protein FimT
VVCATVGLLAAIAFPRTRTLLDRVRLRGAVSELATACAAARQLAILRGQTATLTVDDAAASLTVTVAADTVIHRDLGALFGVSLSATRDAIAYAPTGLGYGASNLTAVVTRGRAADTVYVSRLGRVRH